MGGEGNATPSEGGRRDFVSLAAAMYEPRQTKYFLIFDNLTNATCSHHQCLFARALPALRQTCCCSWYQGIGSCGKPFAKVMLGRYMGCTFSCGWVCNLDCLAMGGSFPRYTVDLPNVVPPEVSCHAIAAHLAIVSALQVQTRM